MLNQRWNFAKACVPWPSQKTARPLRGEVFFFSPASFLFHHEDVACVAENPFHWGGTGSFTWAWLKHSSLGTKEAETASDPQGKWERVVVRHPGSESHLPLLVWLWPVSSYLWATVSCCVGTAVRITWGSVRFTVKRPASRLLSLWWGVSGCLGLRLWSPCPLRIRGSSCGVTAF